MNKTVRLSSFWVLIFLYSSILAQIRVHESSSYDLNSIDSTFFNITSTRKLVPLRSDWSAYLPGKQDNRTSLTVPASFEGTTSLILERKLYFGKEDFKKNKVQLVFMGLNYSAEILINNFIIYKHSDGDIPFTVDVPADIIKPDFGNVLSIKITHELDSENTLPLEQRFLFPENKGGILRDVYLQYIPKTNISSLKISPQVDKDLSRAEIGLSMRIEFPIGQSTDKTYALHINILNENTGAVSASYTDQINGISKNFFDYKNKVELKDPMLWSPEFPNYYILKMQILKGDSLVDQYTRSFAVYSLEKKDDEILLNNSSFVFDGVAYYQNHYENGVIYDYKKLQADLTQIKELGFNTVRFAKSTPHPYALKICEKLGLFAFIEIPVNSITDELCDNRNFTARSVSYLKNFLESYSNYSAVAAIGVGGSYLSNSPAQINFVNNLTGIIKQNSKKLTYASFIGLPADKIDNLDFRGIELYAKTPRTFDDQISQVMTAFGKSSVFISEASYPTFNGSSNGYLNPYSFEAQAKYFSDLIDYSSEKGIPGFFINSMFDYYSDHSSFFSGYTKNHVLQLGILGAKKTTSGISYRLLLSKLRNGEKVTIPIGNKKDDNPLLFILIGLALSIFMAVLMNSKRKFREDATRALIRPYNFFADIRDHRILSGVHSSILMIVLAGSNALIITNVLFFLRTNIFLEKILISFGSDSLINFIAYLSWNPVSSFIYLFLITIAVFVGFTGIVKISSFFIKTKVPFSNIYYSVIWAFLPLALLLPIELVLYKILNAEVVNLYIYITLVLYGLWLGQRLLKGVHVIFDIPAITVHSYTILLLIVILGGALLYYHLTESTVFYIINAFKQFQLM